MWTGICGVEIMKAAINRQALREIILSVIIASLLFLPTNGFALTPSEIFEKVKDSIVVVKVFDDKGKVKGQGSGVLLPSGQIATNCHVVERGISYQVIQNKQKIFANLYAGDRDKDICLLDTKGFQGIPAQLGDSKELKIGAPVFAVGAPQGLELSLSNGIISQLRGKSPPLIQTTAAISPGSSGGGLFDENGILIGLTTLYVKNGQDLNFAIPVEWIKLIAYGNSIKLNKNVVKLNNQRVEWGTPVTLNGIIKFNFFDNCCFEGKSKKTRYAYIVLDKKIDLIENDESRREWNMYGVGIIQISLTDEIKKLSNGEYVSVDCNQLWEGATMHYALPVYCYEPKVINHTLSHSLK